MTLRFCSLSSGSSGNCYLVRTDDTVLLIDAGISASRITQALVLARTDPDEVNGILISHEHTDHIKGLQPIANRIEDAQLFASKGTWEKADSIPRTRITVPDERKESLSPGDKFYVGDIEVSTVPLSHDGVESIGFILRSSSGEVSIITDTGIFTDEMASLTADSDVFIIESNHDTEMLLRGSYPPALKRRILSEVGHLSNEAAAKAVLDVFALEKKQRCVLLAHLSQENNTPIKAGKTVADILADAELYSGRDLHLDVLLRDRMSVIFEM